MHIAFAHIHDLYAILTLLHMVTSGRYARVHAEHAQLHYICPPSIFRVAMQHLHFKTQDTPGSTIPPRLLSMRPKKYSASMQPSPLLAWALAYAAWLKEGSTELEQIKRSRTNTLTALRNKSSRTWRSLEEAFETRPRLQNEWLNNSSR
jgi:hypothetical protein